MREIRNEIPNYFEELIEKKINLYNRLNACGFIFETDFHTQYNAMLSPLISKEIAKKTNIGYFFSGGDLPYAYGTKDECMKDSENALKALKTAKDCLKLFIVRGNHDITIKTTKESGYTAPYSLTQKLLMSANSDGANVPGEKMYYYVDDEENKIRYIVVDTADAPQKSENDYWGVNYGFSEEQAEWLANTALKVPDDGWYVVAMGHISCVPEIVAYDESAQPLGEILKDYKNKRNGKYGDFTDYKGNFVAYICGHNHRDLDATVDNTLFISTGSSALLNDDIWKREEGNISETLFDVFAINKGAKKLYVIRIGAGEDRKFRF